MTGFMRMPTGLTGSRPAFNALAEKQLVIPFGDWTLWGGLIGIAAVTGLIAGSYPALYLSGFNPEIGVRKVLGASVFNIVYLLSTGFTRLIVIAVVIAIPVAVRNPAKSLKAE
jgi:hypothetical protein